MKALGAADPRQVGPYTLFGRLGAGGMGAVYLGRSAGGRTVAVKVVRPDLAEDSAFRDRFRREVAAARLVSGAFTAPVVDADPDGELPWMATAFVPGISLHQAVSTRGPLPEGALRTLTAGLAEALAGVHAAGVVHRDMKPGNVLLALDGPHLIDFGISRAIEGTALTHTGAVIGSAPYMSPEQALGQPVTAAGDVFSLGSTLAYAATGSDLFGEGAGAAVMFRVVHTEPSLDAVPPGLRPLVAACLAKDPGARPTPRQILEAIEREGRPVPSGGWLPDPVAADVIAVRAVLTALPQVAPTKLAEALPEGPGPSRRRLILGVTGGLLAVAGTGTMIALRRDTSDPSGSSGGAAPKSSGSPRPSGDDVPEGRLAWKVKTDATCPQVLSGHGVVACVSLERIWGIDDQGKTKWTVEGKDHGITMAIPAGPNTIAAMEGGRLVVGGTKYPNSALLSVDMATGGDAWTTTLDQNSSGVLRCYGAAGGKAYLLATGDGKSTDPVATGFTTWAVDLASRKTAWAHPESAMFLFGSPTQSGDRVLIGDLNRRQALDGQGVVSWSQDVQSLAVATAGKYFVVIDAAATLSALDPATGRTAWTAAGVAGPAARGDGVAVSQDGSVLYALWQDKDGGYSLGALDTTTGRTRWKAPVPADTKPSGARLLCADGNVYRLSGDSILWAYDAASGKPRWKYTGMKGTDAMKLAWAAGDGRICVYDTSVATVATLHANGA
ncbi:serine/threonine-protein kinase [Streptomyces sp. NBC_00536]|uniref:serine/threonine-protein kinase n=1 Tax=Streptomyces sp. NBC_00536 TaxID=2975769 RepID=UPI002E80D385|nr:PQQ-binding-like beta-propeller repeat protein [Streptomyces sp. NBC_00536]WUC83268.1 serine/threonine-protein kinase [Streptomyces sp. NBC_00536]